MALARFMILVNALIAVAIGLYFFIVPAVLGIYYIQDEQLAKNHIPQLAKDLHQNISPKVEAWATDRVSQKLGNQAAIEDIHATTWPLWSALYYLWATEALQADYAKHKTQYQAPPLTYARKAVNASLKLIVSPHSAYWVKAQWGDDYLKKENILYRAMVISGISAHYKLTQNPSYLDALKQQVKRLENEFIASPTGLLNSYPNTCKPADVVFAYWAIKNAKQTLQLPNDSIQTQVWKQLTATWSIDKLPPFSVDAQSTTPFTSLTTVSGSASTSLLHFSNQLWPEQQEKWFAALEKDFWQQHWTALGFREYDRNNRQSEWAYEVETGPILAGYSFASSTFGLGVARQLNRQDLAYPLSTELIALGIPHFGGHLILPNALSDWTDAPLFGELAVLYNLSRLPLVQENAATSVTIPTFTYLINGLFWLLGILVIWRGIRRTKRGRDLTIKPDYMVGQIIVWLTLIVIALNFTLNEYYLWALAVVMVSRLFPILTLETKK